MSKKKNLSDYDDAGLPAADKMKIAIVYADWNEEVTSALVGGAKNTLLKHGLKEKNLIIHSVPGSYELPMGAQYLLINNFDLDAVICIGCVIQGETRHFDFISDAVANGVMNVALKYEKPVVFGVLTTNDYAQAKERSGGKHGNKGDEAAFTAIKMAALRKKLWK
ncbi:MAG: 6,7-dimethyl-8-ribityllumazine synthase [Bacteroidetes bacterium]|nr:6,7-dimethyl-8-ribityllumazine synthase [Bacteroidota bacterium]